MATDAEIIEAVNAAEGNRKDAAVAMGISQSTVHRAIRRVGSNNVKPPWRGNKRPAKGAPSSKKDAECQTRVPVMALVVGLHELREAGMDNETILRRVEMLLLAMGDDPMLAIQWTLKRLTEKQAELVDGEFLE